LAVDLHTHSTASDGTETPQAVAELAAAAGLHALALTDHDTLSGLAEAGTAAAAAGIELVPGVELSVDHSGVKIHMLAYFIEPGSGPLQDELAMLRAGRDDRNPAIVEKLTELGFPITMAEVEAQSSGETVGRPHIAAALVARGYVADNAEAFDRWIGDDGPAYVERHRLTAIQAIELAHASGGVISIAHPFTMKLEAQPLVDLVRELAEAGLDGIEALHSTHSAQTRTCLTEIAESLGIVATGGSDFHGAGKPDISVGRGTGDLIVPDSALEELRDRRPRNGRR